MITQGTSFRVAVAIVTFISVGIAQEIKLPSGTRLSCRLEQTISSATVGDRVVIPQNSTVIGTVVEAQEKRRMGRTGKRVATNANDRRR